MILITITVLLLLITLPFSKPEPYWLRREKMIRKRDRLTAKYDEKCIAKNLRKLGWKRPENIEISVKKISHPKKNDVRYKSILFGKGKFKIQMSRRAKLRNQLKGKNVRIVGRVAVSLAFTFLVYHVTGCPIPAIFGITNTWDNSDADNVYSNANNWSAGHKPAGTEDVVIPDTSGIGKCTMDESSVDAINSFTINANGEFEMATFTMYLTGSFSNSGTFTCGTGSVDFKGTAQQDVTSNGNALYRILDTNTTASLYLKDDMEAYNIDIAPGATFEIDAVSEGGALELSFTDSAGCGFFVMCAGTLLCQGDSSHGVTITSAGAPPTNYYGFSTNMTHIMDYTTIEYFANFATLGGTVDIDNCTFQNSNGPDMVVISGTITSFTNITIIGSMAQTACTLGLYSAATFSDLTITTPAATSIKFNEAASFEFVDSSFDFAKLSFVNTAATIISDGHNAVATDYYIATGSTGTLTKSAVTNDFGSADNVVLINGIFQADEAIAHNDMTIKNGAELEVNGGITQTITNTGTITVESGGTLDWTGSEGNMITLVSDSPGTQWGLDAQSGSTVTVSYVDATDSDASAGEEIDASDGTSVNGGNNLNWDFGIKPGGGGGPNTKLMLPLELSG